MNIEDLKKDIPYKWRVQSFSKAKPSGQCVAYIDARDAMDILDEVVGPENWQDDYKILGTQLIAGVGIKFDHGWVWKWDTGTESQTEAEKGKMSDAFKRACVKWGVGRFLYRLKMVWIDANEKKTQSNYPYAIDKNKKRIWDLSAHINALPGNKPAVKKQRPPVSAGSNKQEKAPPPRAATYQDYINGCDYFFENGKTLAEFEAWVASKKAEIDKSPDAEKITSYARQIYQAISDILKTEKGDIPL